MGEPSDDDVPTMTSSADLRGASDGDAPAESGAFAEDRTIQQASGNLADIEAAVLAQSGKAPSSELPITPPRPRAPAVNTQTASGTIETMIRGAKVDDTDLPPASEEDVTAPKRSVPAAVAAHDAAKKANATASEPVEDSTLTVTAPSGGGIPRLPLSPPRSVEIKTLDNVDESEETEVRTLAGEVGEAVRQAKLAARGSPKPIPAAGMPPRNSEAEATDDSVTAQSPSAAKAAVPSVPSALSPPVPPARKSDPVLRPVTDRGGGASGGAARPRQASSPGLRLPQKSLVPAKERSPAAAAAVAKAAAASGPQSNRSAGLPPAIEGGPPEDESTTRGPFRSRPHPAEAADDSVTAQSPAGISGNLPPPIDGETEGTTKRHRPPEDSPADGEQDSVTAHAPGHLTNMLRVIAAPGGDDEDDDLKTKENSDDDAGRTMVMAGAPVKPTDAAASSRGRHRGAVAAEQLEPTSESGLRIANSDHAAGERASLGALGVVSGSMPTHERPHSAGMRAPIGSEHGFQSQLAPNMAPRPAFEPAIPSAPAGFLPQTGDGMWEKKPPYAVIVGIVAVISVAIPIILFLVLNSGPSDTGEAQAAQLSPDPVTRGDGARPRKPAASASGSARDKRNGGHH